MRGISFALSAALLLLVAAGASFAAPAAHGIPLITKEALKARLGSPETVIIDVRPKEQWDYSPGKIPGASHEDPRRVKHWFHKYEKDKAVILY